MKIALVCSEAIRESGHGRYMLELARRLAPGHDVHVYSDLYQPVPGVTHHRVRAPEGINLVRVFVFWLGASWALRRARYDVVHTIGGCCARRDVVTAQFCQRPWGAELAKEPWPATIAGKLRRAYHELYWRLADWLEAPAFRTRAGKRLIAVSNGVKQELVRWYGADAQAVRVIYNGVEPAEFSAEALAPLREATRTELGFAPDEAVLLFVGDFYRKGLATAISALGRLRSPKARLLVVGRGEIERFRELAAAAGVADRVTFVGFQRDVVPYFAAADAFVFPTRYEPFGMVVTEAMAAGLPTITTRAAGAAEVITPGESGWLLDRPDDAGELAERLDALLADPARVAAMGASARETARQVDWAYVARETERVYRELLSEKAP